MVNIWHGIEILYIKYIILIITGTGVCASCRFFNCHAASQRYFVGSSCDEAPEKDASATVVQWLDAEDTLRHEPGLSGIDKRMGGPHRCIKVFTDALNMVMQTGSRLMHVNLQG